jgi:hypothetical protein
MKDEIISYREMCDREDVQTIQRGMNFRLNPHYSVILMSQRKNAPYQDQIYNDGFTIEYEGHDIPKVQGVKDPKGIDQPRYTKTGKPTQNGLFVDAVENYKSQNKKPEVVRVYEKILNGVWSERGFFNLVDYKYIKDERNRSVFRFILEEAEFEIDSHDRLKKLLKPRSRIIPSEIKKEVWKRDGGKCVKCGATDELHFDHDLPYSKGGSSITVDNVRILCARHNLEKSNKIE